MTFSYGRKAQTKGDKRLRKQRIQLDSVLMKLALPPQYVIAALCVYSETKEMVQSLPSRLKVLEEDECGSWAN